MSSIKNYVHLLGNIGDDPKVTEFEGGKKVARFSLATNETYKDSKGEKQQVTDWHTIVAWGKTAEIVERYASKGKQIAVSDKLKSRTYTEPKEGNERYVTEVVANEIFLMGVKTETKPAD